MQTTALQHIQKIPLSLSLTRRPAGTTTELPDSTTSVQAFSSAPSVATVQPGADNRSMELVAHAPGTADITLQTSVSGAINASEVVRAVVSLAPDQYTLVVTLGPPVAQ